MRSNRDHDREMLEQEVGGENYAALLLKLQETEPFLRQFGGWTDVIAFMRGGTSDDPRKDDVLRPILAAHTADQDARWRTILMVVFWPGLDSIATRKRRWDGDEEERWQNVVWAFLQVVCKTDPAKRRDRFVQKIVNDTLGKFYDDYRLSWNRDEREVATDPGMFENLAGVDETPIFEDLDRRLAQDAEIGRLRSHLDAGRIKEADFLLLVGTRVYGKTAAESGREIGMNAGQARKRRQRAEAAIRSNDAKFLSRSTPPSPPFDSWRRNG